MDAIEFNKTLSDSFDKLKAGAPEKCLLNAEIWASKRILLLNYFTVV
jgi:hypothetical protein